MRTIGLLGGMSWQSTQLYYRYINEGVRAERRGLSSAKLALYSLDHQEIDDLKNDGLEAALPPILAGAQAVERAGAECLVICTNTVHVFATEIQSAIGIPLLHIGEVTAHAIAEQSIQTVALLGTRWTMQMDFYKEKLAEHGIATVVPNASQQENMHRIIFEELCHGTIRENSRTVYQSIITDLHAQGAEGVILGCTEIPLLIRPEDSPVPIFDTTQLHAAAAVKFALA